MNRIFVLLNKGKPTAKTAKTAGRRKSTISREVRKNHGKNKNRAHKA